MVSRDALEAVARLAEIAFVGRVILSLCPPGLPGRHGPRDLFATWGASHLLGGIALAAEAAAADLLGLELSPLALVAPWLLPAFLRWITLPGAMVPRHEPVAEDSGALARVLAVAAPLAVALAAGRWRHRRARPGGRRDRAPRVRVVRSRGGAPRAGRARALRPRPRARSRPRTRSRGGPLHRARAPHRRRRGVRRRLAAARRPARGPRSPRSRSRAARSSAPARRSSARRGSSRSGCTRPRRRSAASSSSPSSRSLPPRRSAGRATTRSPPSRRSSPV
jgi:hypothetical protein